MILDQKQPRKLFVQPCLALDDAAGVVYTDYEPSPRGMVRAARTLLAFAPSVTQ